MKQMSFLLSYETTNTDFYCNVYIKIPSLLLKLFIQFKCKKYAEEDSFSIKNSVFLKKRNRTYTNYK